MATSANFGRLEDARGARRILLMAPMSCCSTNRRTISTSKADRVENFLRGYDGACSMTSHDREFMNRIVNKIIEIDAGSLTSYSGDYEFYEGQRARRTRSSSSGAVRAPAGHARQGAEIHRAFQGPSPRTPLRSRAASRSSTRSSASSTAPPPDVAFDFCPPRSGRRCGQLKGVHTQYGSKIIYDGFDFMIKRASVVHHGRNGPANRRS